MDKAQKAVDLLLAMNTLDEPTYAKLLRNQVGVELLTIFERYCRDLVPDEEDDKVLDTFVHLMITGYLIRTNETESLFEPTLQTP